MGGVVHFFATRMDLLRVLKEVEIRRQVQYVEAGAFETDEVIEYASCQEIPSLGESSVPEAVLGPIFLMADPSLEIVVRSVEQRRGGTRYFIDQKMNPDTVALYPGGQFDKQSVIQGLFSTCSDTLESMSLFRLVKRIAKKEWTKVGYCSVGPEAMEILKSGGRLARDIRVSKDHDVKL